MKDTGTELVVCVGLYQWNRGDPGMAAIQGTCRSKSYHVSNFASRIITYLRCMGLFGADLALVLQTEILLWIWALQSGRAAEADENRKTLASACKKH